MGNIKIITLIENLVYSQSLVAEHGLSVYIETPNRKLLFDTGQSGLFIQNARKLGIAIEDIDAVVLSHGHYDHTGGLYLLLEVNKKAKVYAKRTLFDPKYRSDRTFIGTPKNEEQLKGRLVYVDDVTELDEGVFIMPNIPIKYPIDKHFDGLLKLKINELEPDEFDDEQYIAIVEKNRINIISACSHRGITNICEAATTYFNLRIGLILGGFHLKNCTTEQYIHLTHYFRTLQPKQLGVCHCTGIEKYADLRRECEVPLFYNHSGHIIELP
jgi:7,8-dihydropterin-6-yl-methyl-4-(beta-D-ribofuranosyl)aminobenzene 5'-phosphate synthase